MLEIVSEPLEPGRIIAGAYRLEHVVGKGGMGVVWAAREIATGRAVALKFLHDGEEIDRKNRERFVREAKAAMTIAHPHVAKVENVLETDAGTPFMVMELLEGESMRDLLRRRRVLPPAFAANILLSVVEAVAAAHAHRIVHRDLKPENVFLVGGSQVRVLDFGIAKRVTTGDAATVPAGVTSEESLTSSGAVIGTPVYMAPEQIFGEEDVDGRADVWSLGIMLYECLAGVRPTDADGFGQIVKRITTDPIEPLDRVKPDVPKVLSRLTMRMLTRERAGRPPLAEIRDVLTRVVAAAGAGVPIDEAAPATVRMPPQSGPTSEKTTPAPAPNLTTAAAPAQRMMPAPPAAAKSPGLRASAMAAPIAALVAIGALGYLGRQTLLDMKGDKSAGSTAIALDASVDASSDARAEGDAAVLDASGANEPDPLLTDAADWKAALRATNFATEAMKRRDGASCLRYFDRYELSYPDEPTSKPASVYAEDRARCLMLTGKCNAGKTLFRRAREIEYSKARVEQDVEDAAMEWCEGAEVTPSEAARRADHRLGEAAAGTTTASPKECREWHATLRALVPKVPRRADYDPLTETAKDEGDRKAAQCLARAGACNEAVALLRDRAKKEAIVDEAASSSFIRSELEKTTCAF